MSEVRGERKAKIRVKAVFPSRYSKEYKNEDLAQEFNFRQL